MQQKCPHGTEGFARTFAMRVCSATSRLESPLPIIPRCHGAELGCLWSLTTDPKDAGSRHDAVVAFSMEEIIL